MLFDFLEVMEEGIVPAPLVSGFISSGCGGFRAR
jgi:hypothetical protein